MLLVWCVFSSIRDRLGSVWWSVIVRLQSLISRHWTKFHGSVAQWCSKSYGSFGNLEFSLWWPGNLSIYCIMILWWYMLLYVYLYKEELSSSDIWWQVKTDLRLCHSYNHKAGHSQYSTFSHGYSMTSKTSLADVLYVNLTVNVIWSLTFLKPHNTLTTQVTLTNGCTVLLLPWNLRERAAQVLQDLGPPKRLSWNASHNTMYSRALPIAYSTHSIQSRCNACGDNPHWRRLSVWLWQKLAGQ